MRQWVHVRHELRLISIARAKARACAPDCPEGGIHTSERGREELALRPCVGDGSVGLAGELGNSIA